MSDPLAVFFALVMALILPVMVITVTYLDTHRPAAIQGACNE